MKVIRQQESLPVTDNLSYFQEGSPTRRRHGPLFPNTIRCIVAGPSGCGKTNLLLTLITALNGVRFQNIYVFAKSLHQPLYRFLEKVMSALDEMQFFSFSEHEDVVSPDRVLPHSIMIFDDVSVEQQNIIRAYFSMGRHYFVDCFYLSQTYSRVPKQLIRDNANMLVLFRQDERNMRHVYNEHVNSDMTFQEFKTMCGKCWKSHPHGFLVIDKESGLVHGRYRMGFDHFIRI